MLQRLARTSAVVCVLMAAAAYPLGGGAAAMGVLGGGALIGISFYLLGSGASSLSALIAGGTPAAEKRRIASGVVLKLAGRYALQRPKKFSPRNGG